MYFEIWQKLVLWTTFIKFLRSGGSFYKPVFPRVRSAKREARSAKREARSAAPLLLWTLITPLSLKLESWNFASMILPKFCAMCKKNHENRPISLGSRHQNVLTLFSHSQNIRMRLNFVDTSSDKIILFHISSFGD